MVTTESENRFRFALALDGTIQGYHAFVDWQSPPGFYLYEVHVRSHSQIISRATTS